MFVNHNGHVITHGSKLAQEHVQALGLRHKNGRTQHRLQRKRIGIHKVREQIFSKQNADHLVAVFADHGVARVPGVHHFGDDLGGLAVGQLNYVHLRARHHHIGDGHVGDFERTFEDGQRIGVQELSLVRITQHFEQIVAIFRRTGQHGGQALKK